jgi:type 1 fimbriae regulatory protein FimB
LLKRAINDRKHITVREVEKLMAATKGGRYEARDRYFLLMMFRHGLRVSEACALQLEQVEIESHVVHLARLKKGLSTTHPLRADGGAERLWLRNARAQPQRPSGSRAAIAAQLPANKKASKNNGQNWTVCCKMSC